VRVLAIDQRLAVTGFADLEDLPVAALADRGRLKGSEASGFRE
jgi:hypothetical protein